MTSKDVAFLKHLKYETVFINGKEKGIYDNAISGAVL